MEGEGGVGQRWTAVEVEATVRGLGGGMAEAGRRRACAVGPVGETPSSAARRSNV